MRRPEQNTALSAKTEQFITAKISSNALKQGSRTYSVLCYVRAVQNIRLCIQTNCKSIRLCIQTVQENTLNAAMGLFTNKKMAARLFRRIAVEQRRYTMRLGWRTPRVDSFKLAVLAYTRIENAHKVRKKTFIFTVFMWLLYVQLLWGQNRYAFVWAVRINLPRTVARTCSLGGLYVCAGRLDIENLLKSPLIYSIPWFNLGLGAFL